MLFKKTKNVLFIPLLLSITITASAEGWFDNLKSKLTPITVATVSIVALASATSLYVSALYKNRRRSIREISIDGKSYHLPEKLLYGRKDIMNVTLSKDCSILDSELTIPLGMFAKNDNNQLRLMSTPTDLPDLLLFGQHLFDCDCEYAKKHLLDIEPGSLTDLLAKAFDATPHI